MYYWEEVEEVEFRWCREWKARRLLQQWQTMKYFKAPYYNRQHPPTYINIGPHDIYDYWQQYRPFSVLIEDPLQRERKTSTSNKLREQLLCSDRLDVQYRFSSHISFIYLAVSIVKEWCYYYWHLLLYGVRRLVVTPPFSTTHSLIFWWRMLVEEEIHIRYRESVVLSDIKWLAS